MAYWYFVNYTSAYFEKCIYLRENCISSHPSKQKMSDVALDVFMIFFIHFRRFPQRFAFYGAAYKQAYPLDMSQYPKLFNSSRIPR